MAASRPLVSIQSLDGDSSTEQLTLPACFTAPIRADIVQKVSNPTIAPSLQLFNTEQLDRKDLRSLSL